MTAIAAAESVRARKPARIDAAARKKQHDATERTRRGRPCLAGRDRAPGGRPAPPRRGPADACAPTASTSTSSPPGRVPAACAPQDVGPKDVRAYVAALSERNLAPSTSARKLAALRALFNSQREHGMVAQNPAELVSTPRRPRNLPRVLKAREAAALLDAIEAGGPRSR